MSFDSSMFALASCNNERIKFVFSLCNFSSSFGWPGRHTKERIQRYHQIQQKSIVLYFDVTLDINKVAKHINFARLVAAAVFHTISPSSAASSPEAAKDDDDWGEREISGIKKSLFCHKQNLLYEKIFV